MTASSLPRRVDIAWGTDTGTTELPAVLRNPNQFVTPGSSLGLRLRRAARHTAYAAAALTTLALAAVGVAILVAGPGIAADLLTVAAR